MSLILAMVGREARSTTAKATASRRSDRATDHASQSMRAAQASGPEPRPGLVETMLVSPHSPTTLDVVAPACCSKHAMCTPRIFTWVYRPGGTSLPSAEKSGG